MTIYQLKVRLKKKYNFISLFTIDYCAAQNDEIAFDCKVVADEKASADAGVAAVAVG